MRLFVALFLFGILGVSVHAQPAPDRDFLTRRASINLQAEAKRVHAYLAPESLDNLANSEIAFITVGWNLGTLSTFSNLKMLADGNWQLIEQSAFLESLDLPDVNFTDGAINPKGLCNRYERMLTRDEVSNLFLSFAEDWAQQPRGPSGACRHCNSLHLLIGAPSGQIEHHFTSLPSRFAEKPPEQAKINKELAAEAKAGGFVLSRLEGVSPLPHPTGSIPDFIQRFQNLLNRNDPKTCQLRYGDPGQIIHADPQIEADYRAALMESFKPSKDSNNTQE